MSNKPKILLYDIETFPNLGYSWGKWEQNIIKFKKHWELASFSWKWLGETEVHCLSRRTHSEKSLVKKLRDIISSADITIAHNGDAFDIKKSRAKFLQFRLKPPGLNKSLDTKKIAKSQFGFVSNSLNELADFLGLGGKIKTGGADLWFDCMDNKPAAWKLMEKYNKHDVVLLEEVYLLMRAWAPNHPNLSALEDREGCPTCGSNKVQSRGYTVNIRTKQQRRQCQEANCGRWFTVGIKKGKK